MDVRTAAVAAVATLALVAGVFGAASAFAGPDDLAVRWTSDTATTVGANHHAPAAGRVDGQGLVFAPVSGAAGSDDCRLAALDGATGETRWRDPVPPANCTLHSVADPALADVDGDGAAELLAGSTTEEVVVYDPTTGAVEDRFALDSYAYSRPAAVDLAGDGQREVVVVDAGGTVLAARTGPDGGPVWRHDLNGSAYAPPGAADFTGDGTDEFAVGLGTGRVVLFDAGGEVVWSRDAGGSVSWTASAGVAGDGAAEFVVATTGGTVAALDGRTGDAVWTRRVAEYAAVAGVADGDGDGDGHPEVYVTARDQRLRALDGATGDTEWSVAVADGGAQMMPPPAVGDLDGDGAAEAGDGDQRRRRPRPRSRRRERTGPLRPRRGGVDAPDARGRRRRRRRRGVRRVRRRRRRLPRPRGGRVTRRRNAVVSRFPRWNR
ncbi:PQQ-binding-like beta-propeller repeat protein [Halobaculum litoreum]|uniref:PQQ-binding-like beta-propeller repeat protein n=1 Tax=Halobaculum litoreum TaxID=3031998 RepID=A0ABD5XTA4_9EURY|nr:PQQ-binding-like beta-propeller repeat protein [Halobaculum sp. DT92]